MSIVLQVKRGTFANMPALSNGEFYLAQDTGNLYIGSALGVLQVNGGGSGLHAVSGTVDFGFSVSNEGDIASVTISAPWATSLSTILANVAAVSTPDHDPDDSVVEGLIAKVENIVPGVGFDIVVYAPQNTWGRYSVVALGE